jgi:2'-5' RNA ligase
MRTFFGLEPDPKTKLAIDSWRSKAFPSLERGVPAANFHITLLFMGETAQSDLEELETILPSPFQLELKASEVGYFSKSSIGFLLIAPEAGLSHIREELLRQLPVRLRKTDKNQFTPHITLFRKLENPLPTSLLMPDFEFSFTEFNLYQSVQKAGNVSYRPLMTFK